MSGLIERF